MNIEQRTMNYGKNNELKKVLPRCSKFIVHNSILGFTLIELLVAISIVGILTGLSLVGFEATRKSARDGKRKADLEQLRSALEIYRTDCKTYPATAEVVSGSQLLCSGNVYMEKIPADPSNPVHKYSYLFEGANSYILCASLEIGGESVVGCDDCGTTCNYKLTNP